MSLSRDHWMEELVILLFCVVAGVPIALSFVFYGIICMLLVVTIPFGIGAFRIAGYLLWPYGREVVRGRATGLERSAFGGWAAKPSMVVGGCIWVIFFSWGLVIMEMVGGIILFCTIIGWELGLSYFQVIPVTVWPIGARVRR